MLFRISWKNIWRNKVRSLVVLISITLGIWAGTFVMAFSWGMSAQYVNMAIKQQISHIQLHNKGFKKNKSIKFSIGDSPEVIAKIKTISGVKAVSARTVVNGMASSATTGAGVNIFGIVPADENMVTGVGGNIVDGDYFNSALRNPVVIGEKMAKKLKVHVRNKIVLTFQDAQGNITSGAFHVVGIFKTRNSTFDELNVFTRQDNLNGLLGISDSTAHEVAVLLADNKDLKSVQSKLQIMFPSLLVENWGQIAPELNFVIASLQETMYLFIGIILIALTFGIVNIMLMAVLERMRELGMLMAIGMNKPRVFSMIMLETFFLSLIGGPLGVVLAFGSIQYFGKAGINLSAVSQGLASYGMDSVVYPMLPANQYLEILGMVFIAAILAAIYPSIKALELNPVNAIRKI